MYGPLKLMSKLLPSSARDGWLSHFQQPSSCSKSFFSLLLFGHSEAPEELRGDTEQKAVLPDNRESSVIYPLKHQRNLFLLLSVWKCQVWSVIPCWHTVQVLHFAHGCVLTLHQGPTGGRLDHKNILWFTHITQTQICITISWYSRIGKWFSETVKWSILTLISDRILLLPGEGTESTHRITLLFVQNITCKDFYWKMKNPHLKRLSFFFFGIMMFVSGCFTKFTMYGTMRDIGALTL